MRTRSFRRFLLASCLAPCALLAATPDTQQDNSVQNELLLNAVVRSRPAEVRTELSHGASPDARDAGGRPAVFLATLSGNVESVRALLEAGATAFNETHTQEKLTETPLSIAAWRGSAELVDMLLTKDADWRPNGMDAWRGAIVSGSRPVVERFLAAGPDPSCRFADGESPVTIAALRGDTDVLALLLEHHGNPDFRDDAGVTALEYAAARGHTEAVRVLLDQGALTWPLNAYGQNAFTASAQNLDPGSRSAIQSLLAAHHAERQAKNRAIDNRLLAAAYAGDLALVKSLLAQGADIEVRGEPNIKLWLRDALSASVAHPTVCQFLIRQGANVRAVDGYGFTPLHTAASEGSADCIRALIAAGADPNAKSRNGLTPLHQAAARLRPPAIATALREGGAQE